MNQTIEYLVRRVANACGLDVHRYRPAESVHGRLARMLEYRRVDIVLDVGANVGQFASSLRKAGYTNHIVSFEPLSRAHEMLVRSSAGDPLWTIAPRTAIGADQCEVEINVSGNSFSSSILDVLPAHLRAAPQSATVETERTTLTTLDASSKNFTEGKERVFIKIDTQGYEDQVLAGSRGLLNIAEGLHLELSFVELYGGQQLFDRLFADIKALGFECWAIWPGIHDPESGRMLQVDATFFRAKSGK